MMLLRLLSDLTNCCDMSALLFSFANPAQAPILGCESGSVSSGNWTDAVQALASVASLLIVILLYVQDKRLRGKEQDANFKRSLVEFRVRRLVLEPNLTLIHNYFARAKAQVNSWYTTTRNLPIGITAAAEVSNQVRQFKRRHHQLMDRVIDPLTLVSGEFAPLRLVTQGVEDIVLGFLDKKNPLPDDEARALQGLDSSKRDFLMRVFEAEAKLLNLETPRSDDALPRDVI